MTNLRPTNLLIALISVALLVSSLATIVSSNDGSNEPTKTKRDALHRAIKTVLLANMESDITYTSSPCVSSWTVSPNGPDMFDESGDITPPYLCEVTAMSGNIYDVSIELIKVGDAYVALPADAELVEETL